MTMSQSLLIKKNKTIMSKSPFGIWRKIKNVWIYFLVRNKGPLFGNVHPDSVITRTPIGYSALWLSLLWLKLGQCHEWTPSEPYTHTRRAASNDTFRSTFYRKLTWIISKCVFFLNQKRNEYFLSQVLQNLTDCLFFWIPLWSSFTT